MQFWELLTNFIHNNYIVHGNINTEIIPLIKWSQLPEMIKKK